MNHLNSNLKYLRIQSGLSLNELAERIEAVGISALSSYEERSVTPKVDTMIALLDLYNEGSNETLTLDNLIKTNLEEEGHVLEKRQFSKSLITNSDSNEIVTLSRQEFDKLLATIHTQTLIISKLT